MPAYMGDTLAITRRVAPKSEIVVLANECQQEALSRLGSGHAFCAIESIPASDATTRFRAHSALNREFRDGFWYFATERFLILADYIRHSGAEDVVHLENDVVLYFDPADKLAAFRRHADFAVPLDRNRAIAGLVWCANHRASDRLAEHLLTEPDRNDMESVGSFCIGNPDIARPLPTIPAAYAARKGLDPKRYSEGIEQFGGVFDAAAIGQYLGGVHWLNNPHDSRFFINESSELDLRDFDVCWDVHEQVRAPVLARNDERVPVLCVHAHSKDLAAVSPFNHGVPAAPTEIIGSEGLRRQADITLALAPQPGPCLVIARNDAGQLLVPDKAFIDACGKAAVIALDTALLLYFKLYVAPRLSQPYVLLALNPELGVGLNDLDWLNHAQLTRCWAQHSAVSHSRLSPLPVGAGDEAGQVEQLFAASRRIEKRALLYAGFAADSPAHAALLAQAAGLGATVDAAVDYPDALRQLARHKFCLCPQGRGLDSPRFWQAQYLDCIPVVIKPEWNGAYAELPLLLLNSWDELPGVNWAQEYVRIKATAYRHDRLSLAWLGQQMRAG
ncbi:MAG TPA: exostosin family protein [Rhodocyclaceae bacterium]